MIKINKSDKGASGLKKRLLFHYKRGKGHLRRYMWNRVRWHVYPQFRQAGLYPDHVDIELSSVCNMVCPMCYTTTEPFKKLVPHKSLDFELFKKIVDDCARHGVYSIRLSWRGEPTLNRHFMDCIRYAKRRGVKEVDSLTNALRLTPAMFEELVDLQMDWLTISFDGTGATYEEIRKPAKFPEMVAKIREFHEIKKRKNSVKPVVRIQGVWPAIKEDPERYFETFEDIVDEVSVNDLLDYLHNDDDIQYVENFTCPVPFQRMVVGSDGRVFMCINDELGRNQVGDLNTQSIYEVWNGEGLRRVREAHIRHEGYHTFEPCKVCYQPRQTVPVPIQIGNRVITLDQLVGREQVVGK
ncbi:MAG: SPASM domain-containing protein [Chloroflexi bacterium]|nr:SPASM domain-containing protein [Chloroflexota bacterium]